MYRLRKTYLYHMFRVFISQDLTARNSHIIFLPWDQRTILPVGFRQGGKIINRGEDIQAGSIGFPQEFDLARSDEHE